MSVWDEGRYESTAQRLLPVAEAVVEALGPPRGRRVLDVACGTGNAAVLAARAGAEAVGVDSAARLVEVARRRAAAEGLAAEFREGDALALPVGDGSFDDVVSVFGVIFAEPEPAAAELLRVVRPGGRIVLTTWLPGGVAGKVVDIIREAFGQEATPPRWSDPAFVERLFAPHPVTFAERSIAFTAASPADYAQESEEHPLWIAARPGLEQAGKLGEVRERLDAVLSEGNEDPAAFRTTSRYALVTVRPA